MAGVKDDVIELDVAELADLRTPVVQVYLACPLTDVEPSVLRETEQARRIIIEEFTAFTPVAFEVYDPGRHTAPGTSHTSEQVYRIDHKHTSEAALVVFCALAPSCGMGAECQIAADATVPRVNVLKTGVDVSRMLMGSPARIIATISFCDPDDLRRQIRQLLPSLGEDVLISYSKRRVALEAAARSGFNRFVVRQRILRGISVDQLAKEIDVSAHWLRHLERDPMASPSLTLCQCCRLASAFEGTVSMPSDEASFFMLRAEAEPPTGNIRASLENLVTFAIFLDDADDAIVIDIWRDYETSSDEMHSEALVGREPLDAAITVSEWEARYKERQERLF